MVDENVGQEQIFVEKDSSRVPDPAELKVAATSDIKKVAGAIFSKFKEYGYVQIRAIGDVAIGRAFRAATIASGYLRQNNVDAVMTGAFFVVQIDNGENRNGSVINIDPR